MTTDKQQAIGLLKSIRSTLDRIEIAFDKDEVMDAVKVQYLSEDVTNLVYLIGLKNGRVLGKE
jgi:predicted RNA-binding protein with EMAP domain